MHINCKLLSENYLHAAGALHVKVKFSRKIFSLKALFPQQKNENVNLCFYKSLNWTAISFVSEVLSDCRNGISTNSLAMNSLIHLSNFKAPQFIPPFHYSN
jgi:hypothetical protein